MDSWVSLFREKSLLNTQYAQDPIVLWFHFLLKRTVRFGEAQCLAQGHMLDK